jgi:hypothetical protein
MKKRFRQSGSMNKTIIEPEKTERLRQLAGTLQMEIRGQRHIIPRVVSVLQRGELGLSKAARPRGSFLFLGPTGVGKTELTQVFTGKRIFGLDKLDPLRHVGIPDAGIARPAARIASRRKGVSGRGVRTHSERARCCSTRWKRRIRGSWMSSCKCWTPRGSPLRPARRST